MADERRPSGLLPPMEDAEFDRWAALLEARTGIAVPGNRKSFLVTSLGLRMRELGLDDYSAYFQHVTSGRRGSVEWEVLVDRLTVHETRFFRNAAALDLVRRHLEERLSAGAAPRSVEAWSVGCATGEEAYSLAMVMDDCLRGRDGHYLAVLGSDISTIALATGRRALYGEHKLSQVPAELLERYFEREAGGCRVRPELRERVCFTRLNIFDLRRAPVGAAEVIFCQNVLIYFRRERRFSVLDNLVRHLRPGGLLILGAGEVLSWAHPDMEQLDSSEALAFRRTPEGRGQRVSHG